MSEFHSLIMIVVTVMSLLGSVCVFYYLIKIVHYLIRPSTSSTQRTVAVLLFSVSGIYFLPMGMQVIFDRYLLPMPVLLLILIYLLQLDTSQKTMERPLPLPLYLSGGLFAVYMLFSVCATHDYLAWNRVRWQSLNNLMREGIKPTEIDGGLEFNGWHLYNSSYKATPGKSWWWVYNDTYMVGASLLPGYSLFQEHDVNTWLPWGLRKIIIGKKSQSGDVTRLINPYSTN